MFDFVSLTRGDVFRKKFAFLKNIYQKNVCIKEIFAYVFFLELYGFMNYIQVFDPFQVYFCVWG